MLKWIKFVIMPNTYPKRWQDRLLRGHINIGPLTIYGANAMHWAINLQLFGTYFCFHPRTKTFGHVWRWYFYVSKDATPNGATYRRGHCFAD